MSSDDSSTTGRSILIELEFPGDSDPDSGAVDAIIHDLRSRLRAWNCGAEVQEVYPGHVVAEDFLPEKPLAEVIEAAKEALKAADGDSNDDEIEALQVALEIALKALGVDYRALDEEDA